jgi:hypothetical protein
MSRFKWNPEACFEFSTSREKACLLKYKHDGPHVYEGCGACEEAGGVCSWCATEAIECYRILAANLIAAATLCRSNVLGYQRGIHDAWTSSVTPSKKNYWRPGCGKVAP